MQFVSGHACLPPPPQAHCCGPGDEAGEWRLPTPVPQAPTARGAEWPSWSRRPGVWHSPVGDPCFDCGSTWAPLALKDSVFAPCCFSSSPGRREAREQRAILKASTGGGGVEDEGRAGVGAPEDKGPLHGRFKASWSLHGYMGRAAPAREAGEETGSVCVPALMLPGCVASGNLLDLSVPCLRGPQCPLQSIIKRITGGHIPRPGLRQVLSKYLL